MMVKKNYQKRPLKVKTIFQNFKKKIINLWVFLVFLIHFH